MTRHTWTWPARAGVLVLATLTIIPIALAGCGGTAPTPTTAAPTAAAAATKAAPTVAAAATKAAPTIAAAAPTAAAAATKVAPTLAAAAATIAPTVASVGTTAAGTTAGQLADAGRTVYSSNCAGCHGAQGEGVSAPPVIGQNIRFNTRFQTGQELFAYISTTMPADRPGSLSAAQYLQVTSFILVQNNFVQPSAPLASTALGGVPLKR